MSLSGKDVEEIMALLESSRFDRLSLEMDGLKLELVREGSKARTATVAPSAPAPSTERQGTDSAATSPAASAAPTPTSRRSAEDGLLEVKSPLLGVFYRAPKPGEDPFVEPGDRVEEDSIIGIIEVMKLMNSARAGISGEVVEICATNGEMVEHGEVLMLVRPD
ncbi:acetyl-CoA carboxylase biotin carboxyl carrier protein [Altericroceibacterium endophyticum]|uniref:Biotin carboxyl carrier protein of acetyl-CoA carboxylase n=1 Tax=Altericroceibacterium endophyticum TaxID=1808508 RepID=A0A6I4T6U3_9SPHN|nr:biotin/lipoyl-containing protein [Altericroceibacterium endophyticum]MXO66656.1 acetyl-CoA carboxylase, biotin carboxyl carrier protein [Altericroceibacterium endophyticum]